MTHMLWQVSHRNVFVFYVTLTFFMSLVLAYGLADNNGKIVLCYSECGCDMWLR